MKEAPANRRRFQGQTVDENIAPGDVNYAVGFIRRRETRFPLSPRSRRDVLTNIRAKSAGEK